MLGIQLSEKTLEGIEFRKQIERLYQEGLDVVKGGKLFGYEINLNNPKEIIAALYLLADDFNRFHEKF